MYMYMRGKSPGRRFRASASGRGSVGGGRGGFIIVAWACIGSACCRLPWPRVCLAMMEHWLCLRISGSIIPTPSPSAPPATLGALLRLGTVNSQRAKHSISRRRGSEIPELWLVAT